jgi:hypothetical protein
MAGSIRRGGATQRTADRIERQSGVDHRSGTATATVCRYEPSGGGQHTAAGRLRTLELVKRAEQFHQANLLRDIFGDPSRPVTFSPFWRTDTAVTLARQMYDARDFSAVPILADALQDAGCDSDDVLSHCREVGGTHVRGCWVVDLVLGKE